MRANGFRWWQYLLFFAALLFTLLLCTCLGSVSIPLQQTWTVLQSSITGTTADCPHRAIILMVRLPRVLCVALVGASLALSGAAMQGLLRNPLADGSTLGISSGASLGAALAILTGFTLPGFAFGGTVVLAILFALASLIILLSLTWAMDRALSTNTIILLGVIFSMFVSSILSLLITFSGSKLKTITFWTMGSLAASSYANAALVGVVLCICGCILLTQHTELNAFTLGESQAFHLGVPVKRTKMIVMITVSCLVGVCVSIGGCIGFVGLAVPHILRFITGPDHRRLLPASLFGGAIFLLLADLAARTIFSPNELPLGVVTSIVGAFVFLSVFIRQRKGGPSR